MTREEAIEILEANRPDPCYQMLREAVDFAVDALKAQDVPDTNVGDNGDTIYRQVAIDLVEGLESARLKGKIDLLYPKMVKGLIGLPSAQPEIIMCKDCIHIHDNDCPIDWGKTDYDFCSYAERRADGFD